MKVSHDAANLSSIRRRVMMGLRQSLLPVLVTLIMVGMPVAALAGDRQDDNDRGGNRHRLIDHKKIKEMKEHKHKHQDGSDGSLAALQAQVTDLQSKLAALTSSQASLLNQLTTAQTQINALLGLLPRVQVLEANGGGGGTIPANLTALSQYLTIDLNPINGVPGPHVIFGLLNKGVNVHIRSGSGSTGDNGTPTGLGNLIVGYNEGPHPSQAFGAGRMGSHNIVGGTLNAFTSTGGLVLGSSNWINSQYATILGGENNQADGIASSILGGRGNWVGTADSTVPPIP